MFARRPRLLIYISKNYFITSDHVNHVVNIDYVQLLTGHPNSNGKRIGFSNPSCLLFWVKFSEFPSNAGVVKSPNVHGDDVSILA